jgi:hypothetical protein
MHGGKRDGAGRKPRSRNKKSADVAAQVQEQSSLILAQLVDLAMNAHSETLRVAAMRELLTRGYGKAMPPEPDEEIPAPKDRITFDENWWRIDDADGALRNPPSDASGA